MKKIYQSIAGIVCVAGLILAGAENTDGSCCLWWTLGWLSVSTLCAIYLTCSNKERRG